MVLITSLAAPFFAGLIAVAASLAAHLAGLQLLPGAERPLGDVGLETFAWSAIPSTLGAIGLTPYVLENGTYGWLQAAVAGVLAFGASALIAPIAGGPLMPLLAFLAGLIALGMRVMLIRGSIINP
jgi:hypothetical protein